MVKMERLASQKPNERVQVVLYLLTEKVYGHCSQRGEGDVEQLGNFS